MSLPLPFPFHLPCPSLTTTTTSYLLLNSLNLTSTTLSPTTFMHHISRPHNLQSHTPRYSNIPPQPSTHYTNLYHIALILQNLTIHQTQLSIGGERRQLGMRFVLDQKHLMGGEWTPITSWNRRDTFKVLYGLVYRDYGGS